MTQETFRHKASALRYLKYISLKRFTLNFVKISETDFIRNSRVYVQLFVCWFVKIFSNNKKYFFSNKNY